MISDIDSTQRQKPRKPLLMLDPHINKFYGVGSTRKKEKKITRHVFVGRWDFFENFFL